ncbi:MAG: hypothetical protein LBR68_05900 [Lachnoclostridium sp.]|nr:hypothetical protein [Lachnoclostridium sp.]
MAQKKDINWPIPDALTNKDIEQLFYPNRTAKSGRKMPDYEYIHRELAKPGVTLSLLWAEYCTQCAQENCIPYQSTQFNDNV